MQFPFETIAFTEDRPVFYRIYNRTNNCFFAELVNAETEYADFQFRKIDGKWKADHSAHQHHAEQIGQEIERAQEETGYRE